MKKKRPKANDQPGLVLVAVRMKVTLSLRPHLWAEQDGSVNCWLLEIHLGDTGNKEDIKRAEKLCLAYYN